MNRNVLTVALLAAALSPVTANAATFCARNATELRNALTTAASNGEADDIRIVRGTYYASGTAPFVMQSTEPHGVRITGGWMWLSGACVLQRFDASQTILDGSSLVPALRVFNFSALDIVPITVAGLTLRHGYADNGNLEEASGLAVYGVYEGALQINVDRVIVEDNVSTLPHQPAVKFVSSIEHVRFTNSIVRDNLTADAPAIHVHANHGGSTLDHLTVLDNVRGGADGGAIDWYGPAHQVYSSLFFGNTGGQGFDLDVPGGVEFQQTFYGTASGPSLPGNSSWVIADPQLDALARPTAPPLVNNSSARISRYDVYGRDRFTGGTSDIGAAERAE